MAGRLLAGIDRHVAAEQIERLLADANGAAIAGGADDAGTGEAVDDPIQSAASIDDGGAISSQISRPSGVSQSRRRP